MKVRRSEPIRIGPENDREIVLADDPLSSRPSKLARPLALAIRDSACRREAAAAVETARALVVLVRPEANPRILPPRRLGENGVQHHSADSLSPALGNDEEQVQEAAA